MVTIKLYKLDDKVFVQGRKEVYNSVTYQITTLAMQINLQQANAIQPRLIQPIFDAVLPSAPFSLSAKSALNAYIAPAELGNATADAIKGIISQILNSISQQIDALTIDWTKP